MITIASTRFCDRIIMIENGAIAEEHMKCATYANDKDGCTAHFIRMIVLK